MHGNLTLNCHNISDNNTNIKLADLLAAPLPSSISVSLTGKEGDNDGIDARSRKGQFGWFTLGNSHIPFIYRNNDEEYCSVRMAEHSALNGYLKFLSKEIFLCINVKSFWVTPTEGSLLNQINFIHSDGQFGRDQFSRDLLAKVDDVREFHQFLAVCSSKLVGKAEAISRLGFVIINKESVVPYTVSKGRRYVPMFYFEGEIDELELKAYQLQGWDLSYLKFCCKIQGIRSELFATDTCSVIDLEDIKKCFPPNTSFEEYWPSKEVNMTMMETGKSQHTVGSWTKPATPQPNFAPPPQLTISSKSGYTYKSTGNYTSLPQPSNARQPYNHMVGNQQQFYNYLNMA